MTQTKTVRLDEDVMKTLADKREGFETPSDCLKRLLNDKRKCHSIHKEKLSEEHEDNES